MQPRQEVAWPVGSEAVAPRAAVLERRCSKKRLLDPPRGAPVVHAAPRCGVLQDRKKNGWFGVLGARSGRDLTTLTLCVCLARSRLALSLGPWDASFRSMSIGSWS